MKISQYLNQATRIPSSRSKPLCRLRTGSQANQTLSHGHGVSLHKHTLLSKDMPAMRVTIQDTATLDCVADIQLSWQSCWQAKNVTRPSLPLATSYGTSPQFPGCRPPGCGACGFRRTGALSGLCLMNGTPSEGSCVSVTLCARSSSAHLPLWLLPAVPRAKPEKAQTAHCYLLYFQVGAERIVDTNFLQKPRPGHPVPFYEIT